MTRKMQFCFMITNDVVTSSESDRDAQISNGFTTVFGKYRTREQRLCFLKILQFPLIFIDKNCVPVSLSLGFSCFQINNGV